VPKSWPEPSLELQKGKFVSSNPPKPAKSTKIPGNNMGYLEKIISTTHSSIVQRARIMSRTLEPLNKAQKYLKLIKTPLKTIFEKKVCSSSFELALLFS
jgi:hypothetical protein